MFYWAVFGPILILLAAFVVIAIIVSIAYPIWAAIRGRVLGKFGGVEAISPMLRLILGFLGLTLLYSLIAPWL